jgi:hypothetical protein
MSLLLRISLLFYMFGIISFPAFAQSDWQVPLHIHCEDLQTDLVFGICTGGSDLFDSSVDILAPPPGFSPYVYFYIESFPYYLQTDMRGDSNQIIWNLRSDNCAGKSIKLNWDFNDNTNQFDRDVAFLINGSVNMLETDSLILNGDLNLEILYSKTTIAYLFSDRNASICRPILVYPNPSNDFVSLNIYIPKNDFSALKIFNLRGHLIRNLSEGVFMAGVHKTNWDGTDFNGDHVPSGNYLVYMIISDHVYTQKITIIK